MNTAPTCSVIGGGVAGLSAAVFLADAGFKVTLLEASPKLGGRAYSFFDKTLNREIDNGQHIMASWYKNTFEYLNIIGSLHKLSFQKSLEIDFTDSVGNRFKFKCPRLFAPMNLLYGLMSYNALDFSGKMAAIRFMRKVNSGIMEKEALKKMNAAELFAEHDLPAGLVNSFWKPFLVAVFNAEPEQTSAFMLVEMIKLGFIEKGNSVLVFPDDFLNNLLVEPAVKFLKECGSEIRSSTAVSEMEKNSDEVVSLLLENGEHVKSDYYISAVPFFNFAKLSGEDGNSIRASGLKASPILSVHFIFCKSIAEVLVTNFIGVLGATIQWIFKVRDDQICIVISSATEESEKDKDEITEIAKTELFNCLPGLKEIEITGSRVVKEMRATFVPDNASIALRPEQKTKYKNFYIAGDWTATNLPATIESAVMSAKLCADSIITDSKKEFSNNK